MSEEFVPFMVRRSFNNPSRQRLRKFRLKFDRAIEGKGHEFSITYDAPDEKTQQLLEKYVNAGSRGSRPRIRIKNTLDGWKLVEPVEIEE